ncbi:hypothetical protein [Nonomuraea guangzhouensis]|uniref:Uncharacterized protein n=1 Tax=Nonomuraea guangzhouensis TaxID=1291555 RepID=A0ABW4GZ78_9ACTN|nr:hypothetical protein [Nonomuraea guangzhouensis]
MDAPSVGRQLRALKKFLERTWRDSPKSIQTAAKGMAGLGAAIIALGTIGDIAQVWANAPFWTNLFSSFAGFLLAVPVGLIILNQITSQMSAAQQLKSLMGVANQLGERLHEYSNNLQVKSQHLPREKSLPELFFKRRGEALKLIGDISTGLKNQRAMSKTDLDELITLGRNCSDAWTWTWVSSTQAYGTIDRIRGAASVLRDYVEPKMLELSGSTLLDAATLDDLDATLDWIAPKEGVNDSPINWVAIAGTALDALKSHEQPDTNVEALAEAIVRLHNAIEASEEANDMLAELNKTISSVCVQLRIVQ